MYKCLLYGCGKDCGSYINLVKYFELRGDISVVGITAKERLYSELFGYKFIELESLEQVDFDIVIVMTNKYYLEIQEELLMLEIDASCIIPCRVLELFEFDFGKYIELKKSDISILAINCWGGFTYHRLGLRFQSPFINMFLRTNDFLKFLKNPQFYLEQKIFLSEWRYNPHLEREYPVAKCADIELYFNHATNFESAKRDWDNRKVRINWSNLFVMMYTNNEEEVMEFLNLNYEKKICFTTIKVDNDYVFDISSLFSNSTAKDANSFAQGMYFGYNTLDLLLDGKIVRDVAKL